MSNPKDYVPSPIDTSAITGVDQDILELLAKNTHEVWAKQRIDDGWTYGEHKDEIKKTTPLLIPYEELSEEEKQYDRNTAEQALKVMMAAGIPLELSPEVRNNLKGMFLTGEEKAAWEQDKQRREEVRQKNEEYNRNLAQSEAPYVISAFHSDFDAKKHGDDYVSYTYNEVLDTADTLEEGLLKLRNIASHWQDFSDRWDEDHSFQGQMFTLKQRERYGGYHDLAHEFCHRGQYDDFSVEPITFFPYGVPEELKEQVAAIQKAHPELFAMSAIDQAAYDVDVSRVRDDQKQQIKTLQASGQKYGIFLENDSLLVEYNHLQPGQEKPLISQKFYGGAGDLNTAFMALQQFGKGGDLPQKDSEEHRHWSICVIQNDPESGTPVLSSVAHFDRQGVRTKNNIWRETTSGIVLDDSSLLTNSEKNRIPEIVALHPDWFASKTTRTPVRRNPEREEQVKNDLGKEPDEEKNHSRHQDDELPF